MTNEKGPNVGRRIRTLREQRGLSLRALAQQCGLSINAISRIERGENSPTVSSLHQLATALSVAITEFFHEESQQRTVFVRQENRLQTQQDGILIESLGLGLRNQQLEPFILTMEPGTSNLDEGISHPGQEFVYCLSGTVVYHVEDRQFVMNPGDSLLFESSQVHGLRNCGDTVAVVLLVFEVARGSNLARRKHLELNQDS
jgi:transcriptional regulator with XRE-family HTH domain